MSGLVDQRPHPDLDDFECNGVANMTGSYWERTETRLSMRWAVEPNLMGVSNTTEYRIDHMTGPG
jgi:hypothetical protein